MSQLSHKLIVKDPFEMPAVDDTAVLVLRECADLVPHCWIWNESVGYLEVVEYSGYDIYVECDANELFDPSRPDTFVMEG